MSKKIGIDEPKNLHEDFPKNGKFGDELKRLRIATYNTQRGMARVLKVPIATYFNWEHGYVLPNIRTLKKVQSYFEIRGLEPKLLIIYDELKR